MSCPFVLATSVTIAPAASDPDHGPASTSSRSRQSERRRREHDELRSVQALRAARRHAVQDPVLERPWRHRARRAPGHQVPAVARRPNAARERSTRRSVRSQGTRRGRGARPTGRPGQSTQPGSLPDSGPPVGPPPRRRRPRRSVPRRSASGSGGTRIVGRVLAAIRQAPLVVTPLVVEQGPAPRTAPFLGEQRIERDRRVDLPTARATGQLGHLDHRERGQRGLDLLERVLVVLEVAGQVALVGRQVEVAVAAQVEQDDLGLAGLAGRQRLVDRHADGVGRLRGRAGCPPRGRSATPASKLARWWTLRASMSPCSLSRLTSGDMPW